MNLLADAPMAVKTPVSLAMQDAILPRAVLYGVIDRMAVLPGCFTTSRKQTNGWKHMINAE